MGLGFLGSAVGTAAANRKWGSTSVRGGIVPPKNSHIEALSKELGTWLFGDGGAADAIS